VYPDDEVTITSLDLTEASNNAFGFNVGAGLDYRFGKSRKVGIGAQVRYTAAAATITPPEGPDRHRRRRLSGRSGHSAVLLEARAVPPRHFTFAAFGGQRSS
jgi:hypothetical protein